MKMKNGLIAVVVVLAAATAFPQSLVTEHLTVTINSKTGDPVGGGVVATYTEADMSSISVGTFSDSDNVGGLDGVVIAFSLKDPPANGPSGWHLEFAAPLNKAFTKGTYPAPGISTLDRTTKFGVMQIGSSLGICNSVAPGKNLKRSFSVTDVAFNPTGFFQRVKSFSGKFTEFCTEAKAGLSGSVVYSSDTAAHEGTGSQATVHLSDSTGVLQFGKGVDLNSPDFDYVVLEFRPLADGKLYTINVGADNLNDGTKGYNDWSFDLTGQTTSGLEALGVGIFTVPSVNLDVSSPADNSLCRATSGTINISTLDEGVVISSLQITHLVMHFDVNCTQIGGKTSHVVGDLDVTPVYSTTPSGGGGGTSGGGGGTGGGGGGTSGGGGGGTTGGDLPPEPPATPANAPSVAIPSAVRSSGIALSNQQSAQVTLTTSTVTGNTGVVQLSAFSEPEGLSVSVSPSAIPAPGNGTAVLTITANANTRPQDYRVLVSATTNGVTSFNSLLVSVICDPPIILGIDQPRSVTINRGESVTLEAKPAGSGPFVYQWFTGQSGVTQNAIAGANGRTFTSPALSATTDYWVRVTNPCGSVDSNTATVTVH